jgi:hypothetical protein
VKTVAGTALDEAARFKVRTWTRTGTEIGLEERERKHDSLAIDTSSNIEIKAIMAIRSMWVQAEFLGDQRPCFSHEPE